MFLASDRLGVDLAAGGQRPPRNPGDPAPDAPVENPDPTRPRGALELWGRPTGQR